MLKARVINKHETQKDWEKAINFTPWQAEVIIYDADAEHPQARIKIGQRGMLLYPISFQVETDT